MPVTLDSGPMDGPDRIGPEAGARQKRSPGEMVRAATKSFTTKDGLIGDYDYGMETQNGTLQTPANIDLRLSFQTQSSVYEEADTGRAILWP